MTIEERMRTRKRRLQGWAAGALGDWAREKGRGMAMGSAMDHYNDVKTRELQMQREANRRGAEALRARENAARYGAGTRVSTEQDLNWGGAAAAPRPKAEFKGTAQLNRAPSEWGARPTGICLSGIEKQGGHSDFRFAGAYTIPFTRFKGRTLLEAAATYDGLSTLHWMATKAKIKSENLKRALEKFLKDPRCAAALEECNKAAMRGKA